MRLWHKDLIPYLPRQQLLGQWRECCCIAKNLFINGTPNHILVNKILDYPCSHLNTYVLEVYREMIRRGFYCDWDKYSDHCINKAIVNLNEIFPDWHNDRYFWQCYYNLQEKYDCGGINEEEWGKIIDGVTYLHRRRACNI